MQISPGLPIPMCYTRYMQRVCNKCNIEKSINDFEMIKRGSNVYYKRTCRECINARNRKGTKKILFDDGVNKQCGNCKIIKPHSDFANKRGKPAYRCKECHNKYYKEYYMQTAASEKHKARLKRNRKPIFARHGLTAEQFDKLKTHDGLCPICNKRSQSVIDHDHRHCPGATGCSQCVRGYICSGCNSALGNAKDSVDGLMALVMYLEVFKEAQHA